MTKICPRCKIEKSKDEFYKAKERKDGLRNRCKKCCDIEHKESYHRNKHIGWSKKSKIKNRDNNLKKRYKISTQDYEKMFKDQNGVCFICQNPQKDKLLAVDHCHTTGKVRGLLCTLCNKGLGCYRDNIDYLTRAIEYLKRNNNSD